MPENDAPIPPVEATQAPPALEEVQRELAAARTQIDLERRLYRRNVLDVEAASLLVRERLAAANPAAGGPDIEDAIEQLLEEKPYLAGHGTTRAPLPAPSVPVRPSAAQQARTGLDQAAARALRSGDRKDLLEYLRKRRDSR